MKLFDWKKDAGQEVFLYNAGFHYGNGFSGQDPQFKGRVTHFSEELVNGDASILIKSVKAADDGNYSCTLPHFSPKQIYYRRLVVQLPLKDRSHEIAGAHPEPLVSNTPSEGGDWLLQCRVKAAFPKPTVEWHDSAGNVLLAEERAVPEGLEDSIVLLVTVTTTDLFTCVVTQEELKHRVSADTFVRVKDSEDCGKVIAVIVPAAMAVQLLLVSFIIVCLKVSGFITLTCRGGRVAFCLSQKRSHHPPSLFIPLKLNGRRASVPQSSMY
ncbi:CD276 antigen homolog isoform X2 [Brachionichthys hirsutus]